MVAVMEVAADAGVARDSWDSSWNLLYRAGWISAFVYILMIVLPLVLLIVAPQPPMSGGAAMLEYIAAHKAVYLALLVSFVGLSLPAIVVFLALGAALAPLERSLALLGAAMGLVSETIALALGSSPPSLNGGLVELSNQYAAAGEGSRPSLASAADALAAYANAVSAAGILTALGILLLSALMLKGRFPKATAILGIVTGASGIALEALRPIVGPFYAVYGLLLPLWFLAAALGLRRIARSPRASPRPQDTLMR
jgi:hypothetical protein